MQNKNWETPICNLCFSRNYQIIWDNMTYWEYKGLFRIVKCKNCNLVFLSPRPPLNEIDSYYVQENYFGIKSTKIDKKTLFRERDKIYKTVYASLLKNKKGRILDIGAGTGQFLSKFKELGWRVEGIELTNEGVRFAKKAFDIRLKKGDFFHFSYPKQSFDVITLNGALEHMYEPLAVLKKSYELLKKGGVVYFSVPNVDSLGNKLFGKNWFPWQPPRHLYHFSPITAEKMLKKAGFKDIKVKHDYWLQNQYILFQSLRYSKSGKFKKTAHGGLVNRQYASTF